MGLTPEQIDEIFTYQPPSPGQQERYELIREQARLLGRVILENIPVCADQTAAIRHLREAVMTANAAIALEGVLTN